MATLKNTLLDTLVNEYGYEREDIKLLTNGKLQQMILDEEEDAKAFQQKKVVATKVSKIPRDAQIEVTSGLTGTLFYHCERTNKNWTYADFGTTDYMTYDELLVLKNRYPKYFSEAWLLILDNEEIQKEFGLTETYKHIIRPEEKDSIFNMDVDELEAKIDKMPDGTKGTFLTLAMQKFAEHTLDSKRVIDMIQRKFNLNFEDNAPLDDIVLENTTDERGVIRL